MSDICSIFPPYGDPLAFLPVTLSVAHIMVIWIKFAYSCTFSFTNAYHVSTHSCHVLLDDVQFTFINGPNIPGSYSILFFTAFDFTSITRHKTTGCCFYFGSISSFFLKLFLHSFPVAYWAPTYLEGSSFSVISFCLFILFMGFSRQEYWSGLPFASPVHHILSELSAMTCLSWVALHSMAHNFIELHKPLHHNEAVICEGGNSINM